MRSKKIIIYYILMSSEQHWKNDLTILYKKLNFLPKDLETIRGQNALVRLSFLISLFLIILKQTWGIFIFIFTLIYTIIPSENEPEKVSDKPEKVSEEVLKEPEEVSEEVLKEPEEVLKGEKFSEYGINSNFFKGTQELYGDIIAERNNVRVNENPEVPYYEQIYGKNVNRYLYT